MTLLVGAMAVGLQHSKTLAANSGTDQAKLGTVEQLLMQMDRDWGKAIVDRNIVNQRNCRG